ncbi:MAG: hypothetical protein CBD47_04615 [Synechococcus sp. TMED187]|jgi:Mg2+ and Co2+ transporter CorA|uniref:hypothetical protein n=1 Tax=Synechococcus sp. UW105 TaxID=337067 RepID=UPI000B64D6D1|nr:MAG: hypothetical protein CBD47_04615 [Synechococcus sp. TMED187]|tara:strand:- start:432 stop:815 length:384 start_codon:yes stop_codon:yes gene_type:complete
MTQSVSFRITRTAEDVAQAINALSQRLVKLEQRLESLELQVRQHHDTPEMPADELARLDDVDRLLMDCQSLLQSTAASTEAMAEMPAAETATEDFADHAVHDGDESDAVSDLFSGSEDGNQVDHEAA